MDIIGEVINDGIPISTPISIRCSDLLTICDDPDKTKSLVNKEFKKYDEYLNSKYKKVDFDIFLTMSIAIDPKTLEKKLVFSTDGLIASIIYNLNYDNICKKGEVESNEFDFDLNDLKVRTEILKKINGEQKLKREFPLIYKTYKMMEQTRRTIEQLKKNRKISSKENPQIVNLRVYEILRENGYNLDIKTIELLAHLNIIDYCKLVAESIENIIDNFDEISEYLNTHPFALEDLSIDKEKLELYLAYRYIKELKINKDTDKQNYVYFVADYFRKKSERKYTDVPEITVDRVISDGIIEYQEGEKITPKSMYLEFRELLLNNPNLKPINLKDVDFSGMTLEEAETFITDLLKSYTANWEIIPKEKYDEAAYSLFKSKNKNKVDYERLKELFMEKVMFYNELDPHMIIKGKKTFDGYIGYIFSNGIVILDKFYENAEKGKLSKGDAIYYMKINDFYKLSNYPKRELMKMPEVGRIIHKGNWKETLRCIISQSGDTTNTAEVTTGLIDKKLIK